MKKPEHLTIRLTFAIPFLCVGLVLIASLWLLRMHLSEAPLKTILLGIALLLVLAFLAGFALAKAISHPLKTLEDKAQAVIQGNLAQEVALPRRDELGSLGDVFNNMVAAFNRYLRESVEAGVVMINHQGFITGANHIARQLLNTKILEGKRYNEVFASTPELLQLVEQSFSQKKPFSAQEVKIPEKDLVLNVSISIFKDTQAALPGLIVFFRETTQLRELQRQLAHADRLVYLGTLTAGLAHEIRNPLAALQGLVELMESNFTNKEKCQIYLKKINEVIVRLDSLVKDMLAYAHADPEEFKPVDINQLLEETLTLLPYEFNIEQIELVKELFPQQLMVMGDKDKLLQVFNNILRNALQATPVGGSLIIKTTATDKKAIVEITNTGSYIPPEDQEKIFVPFYTTKTKGTGLGLPIAKRIIENHGGKIKVKSSPEKTTNFIIELPLAK